jgi:hypothetical protein
MLRPESEPIRPSAEVDLRSCLNELFHQHDDSYFEDENAVVVIELDHTKTQKVFIFGGLIPTKYELHPTEVTVITHIGGLPEQPEYFGNEVLSTETFILVCIGDNEYKVANDRTKNLKKPDEIINDEQIELITERLKMTYWSVEQTKKIAQRMN